MTTFTSHAPGTPSWVDLMSPDVEGAIAFYGSVFGWEAEEQFDDEGNRVYVMFHLGGKAVAGLGGQGPGMEGMPAFWNTYITTDDCAATMEKVTANGGTVMMPPMQVMDAGEMAIFTDPSGAAFSVWKPLGHIGAEIGNEPNTYSWSELNSRDIDAALPFYAAVFGWEYEEGMPGYSVIKGGTNDEGLGGAMAMPEETPEIVPSHWAVYFSVADLDASVAKVTAGGGQIVVPAMEIPGIGTMVVAHDPAGGNFAMMQPADA